MHTHASTLDHTTDRSNLDSLPRDGKIDPEELGTVFQQLRHKTKKVSGNFERACDLFTTVLQLSQHGRVGALDAPHAPPGSGCLHSRTHFLARTKK